MYNKHIKIFNELSKIYEKLGDDIRATAYHHLAKKLYLYDIFRKKNKNTQLVGITEKSQKKINEITTKGKLNILQEMKKDKNIQDKLKLIGIIGVGPSLADKMIKREIRTPKDFIEKYDNPTQLQKLGMKYYGKLKKPTLNTFYRITKVLCNQVKGVNDITIAGSYRTGNPKPGDIDIIICSRDGKITNTIQTLTDLGILVDFVYSGKEDILGVVKFDRKYYKIDIKVTVSKYFASYMLYFGSGKYFSKYIRGAAKEQGYKLNQYGITLKNGDLKTFRSEKTIFKFLKIPYLTPQDRVLYY
tara:strand:- start:4259 stop:5161 length:903 start_codon:yes stop_codon:yes gene_type:complete